MAELSEAVRGPGALSAFWLPRSFEIDDQGLGSGPELYQQDFVLPGIQPGRFNVKRYQSPADHQLVELPNQL